MNSNRDRKRTRRLSPTGTSRPQCRRHLTLESLEDRSLMAADIDVSFRIEATSLQGEPLSAVTVGQHFKLNAYTTDVRANPQGVFAGYLDVDYNGELAAVVLRERESIQFDGSPTAGTFKLTFRNETTTPITFNAASPDVTRGNILTALEALNNIEPGEVTVLNVADPNSFIGAFDPNKFVVKFGGQYANQNVPNLVGDASGLVGGSGITITETGGAVPGNAADFLASVSFGPKYPNGASALDSGAGSTSSLNEFGAFDGFIPLGGAEQHLFSVEFVAKALGAVTFASNPADILPPHDVLVYGNDDPVPSARIAYGSVAVQVQPNPFGSLSGFVYVDANNDGIKQSTEAGISDVAIVLAGVDSRNQPVARTTRTNASGRYEFAELLPGSYLIVEVQPLFYRDGRDTIGSQRGRAILNDVFAVKLRQGTVGINNNFGERLLRPRQEIPLSSVSQTSHSSAGAATTGTAPQVSASAPAMTVSSGSRRVSVSSRKVTVADSPTRDKFGVLRPQSVDLVFAKGAWNVR